MKIIGVDPAPKKGLQVFDGEDRHVKLGSSRAYLAEVVTEEDVLLCWDSPLTGPPSETVSGSEAIGRAFTQRPIESFFSLKKTGFKTPEGISVRSYSGCPHWAISRSLVGLPRTGPFDAEFSAIPFQPVVLNTPPGRGRHIVEVHPALALWLWCRDSRGDLAVWEYKSQPKILKEVWEHLIQLPSVRPLLSKAAAPQSDDELDARVAWALGRLWIDEPGSISLLGNLEDGTFLLPKIPGLDSAFRSWREKPAVRSKFGVL